MKIALLYVATAVLLGTALMLAPVLLFPAAGRTPYRDASEQFSPFFEATQRLKGLPEETEALFGVRANQPTDAVSVGIVVTVSLVFALGASVYLKKRTPSSITV